MLVTFLRHATAEDRGLTASDEGRALVKKGREQVQRVAEFCRRNALLPAALYCSPLLRAQQTATLLQSRLPGCPVVNRGDWLSPGAGVERVVAELQALEAEGFNDVWLIGHEPDISLLLAALLGVSPDILMIKKASLTRIDVDFASGCSARLMWGLPCALMY